MGTKRGGMMLLCGSKNDNVISRRLERVDYVTG